MSNPSLRTDGVNDFASFTGAPAINAGTSAYVWWFKGTIRQAPTGICGFVGTSSSGSSSGFVTNVNLNLMVYSSGSLRYSTPSNFFIVGEYHHYRLEHDAGGDWRAYRDDMTTPVASGSYSNNQAFATLNQMFRSSSGSSNFLAADVEEIGLEAGSFSETWRAVLSGGTGGTLPTVSGNNNASLINFPTDDSQWIDFGALDKEVLLTSIGSTASLSSPTVTKDKQLNLGSIDSTASVTAPQVTKDKALGLPIVTSTSIVRSPTVTKDTSINLGLPTIPSTLQVHQLTLLKDKLIQLLPMAGSSNIYEVDVKRDKFVALDGMPSEETWYPLEVIGGAIPLPDVELFTAEGYGLHIRSAKEMQELIVLLAKRIEILEGRIAE